MDSAPRWRTPVIFARQAQFPGFGQAQFRNCFGDPGGGIRRHCAGIAPHLSASNKKGGVTEPPHPPTPKRTPRSPPPTGFERASPSPTQPPLFSINCVTISKKKNSTS